MGKQGNSTGKRQRTRRPGFGRIFRHARSRFWHIAYYVSGRGEIRESSRSEDRKVAEALLLDRQGLKRAHRLDVADSERVTLAELLDAVIADKEAQGQDNLVNDREHVRKLKAFFGDVKAIELGSAAVNAYRARRQKEQATRLVALARRKEPETSENELRERIRKERKGNATINQELKLIRRAYNLAGEGDAGQNRIRFQAPGFKLLPEPRPRRESPSPEMAQRLIATLPEHLADWFEFAYWSGWRREEITGLRWEDVDWTRGVVILASERSKNEEERSTPIELDLERILRKREKQRAVTLEDGTIALSPYVFHKPGSVESVGNFKKAWKTAIDALGYTGLRVHDVRKATATHLCESGVAPKTAMELMGHKTTSMLERYHIVKPNAKREAMHLRKAYELELLERSKSKEA